MKWYNIKNENKVNIAEQKKYRDVFILDEIGGYGVYARTFIRDLMEVEADVINLHIDSAGGSITDGVAIYNALRAHSAEVHTYVDGIAASIASIIYLAGDERYIPENAGIFTHLPMLAEMDMPNRNDLQEAQDHLAKFEQVLANIYMKHTGADEETVRLWMENDTWFFGQEAVDSGFATQVVDKVAVAAQYDPKKYKFLEGKHPSLQVDAETKTPEQEAINMDEVRSEADIEVQDEVVAEEVVTDVVEETASEIFSKQ
jgi:ATP-dependent protease ClpP protease subunit